LGEKRKLDSHTRAADPQMSHPQQANYCNILTLVWILGAFNSI